MNSGGSRLGRFLCWLGFHDWDFRSFKTTPTKQPDWRCLRCFEVRYGGMLDRPRRGR